MTSPAPDTLNDAAATTEASQASAAARQRQRQRSKGIARAYKRMDSKRALSSSKLMPLSPIKESKPKLTSSSSHRSILDITELIDFDEGSLHDSILGPGGNGAVLDYEGDDSFCSEITEFSDHDGEFGDNAAAPTTTSNGSSSCAPRMPTRGDSIRKLGHDSNNSIPPELLMEDPTLADIPTNAGGKRWVAEGLKKTPSGRWTSSDHTTKMPTRLESSSSLTRQDSWASVNSFISSSGDSVDTFVLSKATRLL